MGARPADGGSVSVRSDGPARSSASRTTARSGPLVARRDLDASPAFRAPDPAYLVPEPRGRVRRFVHRYGWRAYAIPLLTVATVVTLGDLAANGAGAPATTVDATTPPSASAAAESPVPVAEGEGVPDDAASGGAAPKDASAPVSAQSYVEQGAGSVSAVDLTSPVYGTGPLERFVVETEDGIHVDGPAFAQAVRVTLADPRSWGHGGRMSFQQVDAAAAAAHQYDFKVTLVSPGNMERYCPGVGTGGYTSCRYGERAVINLARWATAVPFYEGDIATYRHYVINHEVGHALGNGHQRCPAPGGLAPVMQQQTLGLQGCVKNAWPYP